MTYHYAREHHNKYYITIWSNGSENEHRKVKDDGCRQHLNLCEPCAYIEHVEGRVYIEQHYSLNQKNEDKEIPRRINEADAKHQDLLKSKLAICLKRQVYNFSVMPDMADGAESWTLAKQPRNKLAAAHTKLKWVYSKWQNIGQKDQHQNQREDKSHRHNLQCEKYEVVLDRAHQPPQIRQMDLMWVLMCHHSENIQRTAQYRSTWRRHVEVQPLDTTAGNDEVMF